MKTTSLKLSVLGLAALVQCSAYADYIPLPVKWSQPIGTNSQGVIIGSDRPSDDTLPWVMADDFLCTDPDPVMAVRWWGSYLGAPQRQNSGGFTVPFDIGFLSSVGPHPRSLPGVSLLEQVVLAQEVFVGIDQAGDSVYRYDAYLTSPFQQIPGTEYFLRIDQPTALQNWGWHDANGPHPILDWAALGIGHTGPWFTFQPKTDLAFEVMIPEPSTAVLALTGGGLLLGIALRRRK